MVSFFCHTSPPMMHCTDTGQQVMELLWAENSKTISKFFFFFLITNCFRYCITVMKKDILQPAYHSFLTPTKYIFSYSIYQILLSDTSKYCSLYQNYSSSFSAYQLPSHCSHQSLLLRQTSSYLFIFAAIMFPGKKKLIGRAF